MAQCQVKRMLNMDVGKKLKELRERFGYTQQYVADYLQIDRSNYSKYELDKLQLNLDMLKNLCILYSISADYIIGIKNLD